MFKPTKPSRFRRLDSRARFVLLPFAALLTVALFTTLAYFLLGRPGVARDFTPETFEAPEGGF